MNYSSNGTLSRGSGEKKEIDRKGSWAEKETGRIRKPWRI